MFSTISQCDTNTPLMSRSDPPEHHLNAASIEGYNSSEYDLLSSGVNVVSATNALQFNL